MPGEFQLEPEDYERVLRGMFVERFGTNVLAVLQSNMVASAQQAKAEASKAPRERGIRKIIRDGYHTLVSFAGSGPSRTPAEKRLTRGEREVLSHATPELMEQLLVRSLPMSIMS